MKNKYQGYCMEFSNADIKTELINYVQERSTDSLIVKMYSKDYEEISIESTKDIKTIAFGENIMIDFIGKQTSIFVCDEEIMFIDENAKRYSYTISDVFGNAVYEGSLRCLEHCEMLKMFAEIVICLFNAETVDILEESLNSDQYINNYYYIDELKKYTIVADKQYNSMRETVFDNIVIKY